MPFVRSSESTLLLGAERCSFEAGLHANKDIRKMKRAVAEICSDLKDFLISGKCEYIGCKIEPFQFRKLAKYILLLGFQMQSPNPFQVICSIRF